MNFLSVDCEAIAAEEKGEYVRREKCEGAGVEIESGSTVSSGHGTASPFLPLPTTFPNPPNLIAKTAG